MTNEAINKVIQTIADDMLQLSRAILANDKISANGKIGKNTLKGSALDKDVQIMVSQHEGSPVIEALFSNYVEYIEQGRKPRTGKQPPLDALRDWALSKGILTDNGTLFLISRAIWRDGHEGRPILATLSDEIEKQFEDKWADQLLEAATQEITKYFN